MAPATVVAVKLMVDPAHTGLLLPAVGVVGIGFTVTDIPELVACSQGVTPDVSTTFTRKGLVAKDEGVRDDKVKVSVALGGPTFTPFTCH